jgi:2-keto-4-pentenoate hydratase/2-oxohepta-3-ene-1,7-dioic acid hydratase in catechol pathway
MKLASYTVGDEQSFGLVVSNGLVDLKRRGVAQTLRELLNRPSLPRAADFAAETPDFGPDDVVLVPVIPDAAKIICVGINYLAHAAEGNRAVSEDPILFLRTTQSIVGSGSSVVLPRVSGHYDYEGELALVIGRRGRHVATSEASGYIAGYCCFNDGSVRDYQNHSLPVGKNFEKSGACGPWLVTPDEAGHGPFDLTTRINGEVRQHVCTDQMIYPIADVIAYASRFTELLPGDIIATGTPSGVGARRSPPQWLEVGDQIEVEISRLGSLRNTVAQEAQVKTEP